MLNEQGRLILHLLIVPSRQVCCTEQFLIQWVRIGAIGRGRTRKSKVEEVLHKLVCWGGIPAFLSIPRALGERLGQ